MKHITVISNRNGKRHSLLASEREVIATFLVNGWALESLQDYDDLNLAELDVPLLPPRRQVQASLFDDSAVDDWGDSAELRKTNNCQPRLL